MVVQNVDNEEVITPINIKEYLADERIGIFKLTARVREQCWRQSSKWVIATDLGILTKKAGDDLWVWVNSLSQLTPITDAEIKLIRQNNQTRMTARTNNEGIAIFENFTRYTEEFLPYLITASFGQDLSFLELQRRRIPRSDFDVGGVTYLQHGYEAFFYNERGCTVREKRLISQPLYEERTLLSRPHFQSISRSKNRTAGTGKY